MADPTYSVNLTAEMAAFIEDAVDYYQSAGFGGMVRRDDPNAWKARDRTWVAVRLRVDDVRERDARRQARVARGEELLHVLRSDGHLDRNLARDLGRLLASGTPAGRESALRMLATASEDDADAHAWALLGRFLGGATD